MTSTLLRATSIVIFSLFGTLSAEMLPSVTHIKVTERSKTSFTVAWEQPPSQFYEVFLVKISPPAAMQPSPPSTLSRTFTDLRPGAKYIVAVQGFTRDGLSSERIKYPVWTTPEEPIDLTLSPFHEIEICISIMGMKTDFTAVVDGMEVAWKDADAVNGYELKIIPSEGVTVSSNEDDDFSGSSKRIVTGLTPGKEYSVTLRSHVGPAFDPVYSDSVMGEMTMPPAIPYSAEIVDSEPTSVVIKTHGPLEGIHDDLHFDLKPNHGTVGQPRPDPIYPMFELRTWRGLRPATRYTLDIYSVSKNVRGYQPKTITFTTMPGAPMRLRVDDFGHSSVTLQWGHPHKFSNIDEVQYLIEFFTVPNGKTQFATVKNFKLNQPVIVEVQKLIPGTIYDFRVFTILNGVKGTDFASVIQTTIPRKPTVIDLKVGDMQGIDIVFGKPVEGECPNIKVFYSPGLNGIRIKPEFFKLGETVTFPEFPVDGKHRVHARCVSQNVEGPELLLTITPRSMEGTDDDRARNDEPDRRIELPCSSLIPGVARPDSIAPDACCNDRPYNSEQKECCGSALLRKGGDRLCCGETPYNKKFFVCCAESIVNSKRDGCSTMFVKRS